MDGLGPNYKNNGITKSLKLTNFASYIGIVSPYLNLLAGHRKLLFHLLEGRTFQEKKLRDLVHHKFQLWLSLPERKSTEKMKTLVNIIGVVC